MVEITYKDTFLYELGVMMHNAYSQSVKADNDLHDLIGSAGDDLYETRDLFYEFTNGYDICGNFTHMVNSLILDINDINLILGFFEEGRNHNKSEKILFSMFDEAIQAFFY